MRSTRTDLLNITLLMTICWVVITGSSALLAEQPITAAEKWNSLLDERHRERDNYQYPEIKPEAVNILVIGGEIASSYINQLRDDLSQRANIFRRLSGRYNSATMLSLFENMEAEMRTRRW